MFFSSGPRMREDEEPDHSEKNILIPLKLYGINNKNNRNHRPS